jgi:hypothetical protein
MPGPLDDTLKYLMELSPQDRVVHGGWPAAPAALIDADIATITGATDKVIRVNGPPDWLLAVDFQAGHDTVAKLPDLLLYTSALFTRHSLRVRSLLVQQHRGADSPRLTGLYERGFPGEPFDVALRYHMVRVWQVPPERWLAGWLSSLPLAPLGAVQEADLPVVVAGMKQRLERDATPGQADLWSAANILMGACYPDALIDSLLPGVIAMEESVTYQKIIRKGEAKGEINEARKIVLLGGRTRFGEPPPDAVAALEAVTDVARLEGLVPRLFQATSWQDLLGLKG